MKHARSKLLLLLFLVLAASAGIIQSTNQDQGANNAAVNGSSELKESDRVANVTSINSATQKSSLKPESAAESDSQVLGINDTPATSAAPEAPTQHTTRSTNTNDTQTAQATPESNDDKAPQLITECPQEWIQNQMPQIRDGNANSSPQQYYIADGVRRELSEYDTTWVQSNCALEPQIVY